jgi:hypothetical protein
MTSTTPHGRGLEKYQPLETVLVYDDFDLGLNGWLDLTPNYVHEDFQQQPSWIDLGSWGPVMLSSAPMRLAASHGSMEGTYSLKLRTRGAAAPHEEPPAPGSMSIAIKRLSGEAADHGLIQIEAWFSYTVAHDRVGVGGDDVRAFGFFFDIQDEQHRWQPAVRYVNAVNGVPVHRWQFGQVRPGVTRQEWCLGMPNGWEAPGIDSIWAGRRYSDGTSDGFQWLPDGAQNLVFNESPDKLNWMYFRLTVDRHRREYVEFQCMEKIWDMRGISPTLAPCYEGITNLINPVFFAEADNDRVSELYLDSVVYSTGMAR